MLPLCLLIPEPVGRANEVGIRPLLPVGRKKDFPPKMNFEIAQTASQPLPNELVLLPLIDQHLAIFTEVNEAAVIRSMKAWRETETVANVVRTPFGADRQNVCSVDQTQLQAGYTALAVVCDDHFPPEVAIPREAGHLCHKSSSLRWNRCQIALGDKLGSTDLCQQR